MGPNNIKRVIGAHFGEVLQKHMSCTKPLVRMVIDHEVRVIGMKTFLTRYGPQLNWECNDEQKKCKEIQLRKMLKEQDAQLLPCGHCPACKLATSQSWANRMELELPYHDNAWFLTLTYDDDHIPYRATWDNLTGEVVTENYSLRKEDVQLFWKRLRRYIEYHKLSDKKIIYYQAGEYGGTTHRPHYHAIVYDLPIKKSDLKVYKKLRGNVYYNCKWLEDLWGKGYVVIAPAEWKAMAYTARYTTKKIYGKESKEYYEGMGIIPEYCVMSKGIGEQYYYDHVNEIYPKDSIQLKNGKVCKPPRYFDKLFDRDHAQHPLTIQESEEIENTIEKAESEELKQIRKERRRIANDALFAQLKQTGLTMQEYYTLKDAKMQERMKKLIRNEV